MPMPQERVPHGVTIVKLRQLSHPRLLKASLQPEARYYERESPGSSSSISFEDSSDCRQNIKIELHKSHSPSFNKKSTTVKFLLCSNTFICQSLLNLKVNLSNISGKWLICPRVHSCPHVHLQPQNIFPSHHEINDFWREIGAEITLSTSDGILRDSGDM